jgi:hypothetical protein
LPPPRGSSAHGFGMGANRNNRHSLGSATHWKVYTDFSGDIDLNAEGGGPCRSIRINAGSGALHLKDAEGTALDAIPSLSAGDEIPVIANAIVASGTSGITSVTVYW